MTGIDHQHTAAIEEAARFLALTPPLNRPSPLVPHMKDMFGLSAIEVCEAIRHSHQIRTGGVDATS